MKKSNIILISIIVIILIIVVLGGCIIYFGTDLLKTDKQLFMKYASQMLEGNSEGNKVLEYMDKKQQNSYISSGKITANNSSSDEEYQELLDIGNEVSISFEKQKDIINNEEKLDINLNYSENVKFPIELVRSEDTIGIKSEEVVNKYVAFENNNLKAFCQKLGMTDVSDIPDKIDLEKIESTKYENIFTEQEIESLNERYGQVIDKYITNENFSKEENGTEVAYVLEITKDQFYNIIEACLTELKTDNILLQKIADIQEKNIDDIEAEISDGIDELINNIEENKDENIDGDNIKISVYQTNGKATRIEIGYSNFKISIKREQNEDKEKLEISVNMAEDDTEDSYSTSSGTNEMVALISIEYTGLSDMTNVSNIIEVSMTINSDDDEMEFNYKLENEVEFVDNVSIDDITEYNAIVLKAIFRNGAGGSRTQNPCLGHSREHSVCR